MLGPSHGALSGSSCVSKKTAAMLHDLFGWEIRWEGQAMGGLGYTVHIGTETRYIAVYSGSNPAQTVPRADASYETRGALNHIGVVVDDLDLVEAKVKAEVAGMCGRFPLYPTL